MKREICILDERKKCTDCGECDRCDIHPDEKCTNCGKCIEPDENFAKILIDKVILDNNK